MSLRPLALSLAVACGGGEAPSPPVGDTDTDVPIVVATPVAPLALCINEFVADSDQSWADETGAFPDWIELHNRSAEAVSLAGYALTDDPSDAGGDLLDPSLIIEAGGFLVLSADGLPELGPTHLPYSLSAEGEGIGLFRPDGAGEILTFGTVESDFAWARRTDCCTDLPDCVSQVWLGTPEASNGGG